MLTEWLKLAKCRPVPRTFADNYFQGFKLLENKGTYTTPLGDASQIEIVLPPCGGVGEVERTGVAAGGFDSAGERPTADKIISNDVK